MAIIILFLYTILFKINCCCLLFFIFSYLSLSNQTKPNQTKPLISPSLFRMLFRLGILISLVAAVLCSYNETNSSSTLNWCRMMRSKYDVLPGKSFGKLPFNLHAQYLSAECYKHFCKPHPLVGKGKFMSANILFLYEIAW